MPAAAPAFDTTGAVLRYRPSAVILPSDGPLSRRFHDPRQHLPGHPPLESDDYLQFDRDHVLHDVYLSPRGDAIEAIGPPLVNLARQLLPLRATLPDGTVLRHRPYRAGRATHHRFALPSGWRRLDTIEVRLRFANGFEALVPARRTSLAPVCLQLTTLQRDNPTPWIVEWLKYVADLGTERVLFYDNASADADGLFAALAQACLPLEVVFVDWPFVYGPQRSHYNVFCQSTQNNHAHRCFGAAQWTGHFDIDEYPVCRHASDLRLLLGGVGARTGLVRLDSHWVPDVRDTAPGGASARGPGELPDVCAFEHRERAARGTARKYFARSGALRYANTHNGRLRPGWLRRTVDPSEACYFHYKALTTDWRERGSRGAPEAYDASRHVRDDAVIARLERRAITGSDRTHGERGEAADPQPDPAFSRGERFARSLFRRGMKDKTTRRLVRRLWAAVPMTIGGLRYELHPADNTTERFMYEHGWFDEPRSLHALRELVHGRRCLILDIGANCGAYALPLAAAAGAPSRVLAFEPSPIMAARLERNVALNALDERITVHRVALSASRGSATLAVHPRNHGQSSLRALPRSTSSIVVPCAPLADFVPGTTDVDRVVVKIDVEGREDAVLHPFLSAATDTALPDALLIETVLEDRWALDLRGLLSERGYRIALETEGNALFRRAHR